jgi:predicted nucleotidyltransferase
MKQLLPEQRELVLSLTKRLGAISGVRAVALGGSYARGCARPDSDIDLGLLYAESAPFSIRHLRDLAEAVDDTGRPVVTEFYEWGRWVNGGAWLTIGGQRVDLLYRSLERLEWVMAEAVVGRYELDYDQQPLFGFFSGTYLGEITVCVPLFDPEGRLESLKWRVADYPEALRRAVVQDYLWAAEFGLAAFAPKFAARADTYGTAACLTRAVNQLVLALFALNRKYPLNDKTALTELAEFELAPSEFGPRAQKALKHLGTTPSELSAAVEGVVDLARESVALAGELYRPRYALPK